MEKLKLIIIFLITLIKIISTINDECPNWKCGSTGICVENSSLCPTPISCHNGFKKTNQFTCSNNDYKFDDIKCERFTCWDNSCVDDAKFCPSMSTCPATSPLRCSDNSCVQNIEDCPKYVTCPLFIPVRCPNGDCRKSLKDCPSRIQCPKEFAILCNDGSCRMTSDQCEVPTVQTQCIDQTMTRCPDGTCTNSKFLCPTQKSCPNGLFLCWNGKCSKSFSECEKPQVGQPDSCSDKGMVKCSYDGSCRKNILDCPTTILCTVDKPVKCWDNSCKESIEKCPVYQECPEGTKNCEDGTCSTTDCGTHITCSMDAPFKCYDNTCRRNPNDCPNRPDCPDKFPILCWDDTCVAHRSDCRTSEKCLNNEPVKCPDHMCRKSSDDCKGISDCPTGFIRCKDGSCKRKQSDCRDLKCPINTPIQCDNGLCVVDKTYCDNSENGCPYYAKYKCTDGSCEDSSDKCKILDCPENTKICPDGSCYPDNLQCPNKFGCPNSTPFRCADGNCIDPSKSSCSIPVCPPDTPIRCLNGQCTVTQSSCLSSYDISNIDECKGNIMCADGKCAKSPEECKLTFNCPIGQTRCEDGTCRNSINLCPKGGNCPKSRPKRCSDGSCTKNEEYCLNLSGCPNRTPIKCSNTGLCVNSQDECIAYENKFSKSNGCSKYYPIKCLSGKCVNDLNQCIENPCKGLNEFPCPNSGKCVTSWRNCPKTQDCEPGYVRCLDGTCRINYEKCENIQKCSILSPFRCIDGDCKKFPYIHSNKQQKNSCDLGIQCPDYKPYLCADGSCAKKGSFCNSLMNCPDDKPIRCFDRSCSSTSEECENKKNCPPKNPFLCPITGNCVDNIFDCIDDYCPKSTPFKCSNGQCVSSPRKCVINKYTKNDICDKGESVCYDGSCRTSLDQCPIYPGCTDPILPYKCKDGSCATNQIECNSRKNDDNLYFNDDQVKCSDTEKLCEDGICRPICPEFNGCPNDNPLHCPNGLCVKQISECAGESDGSVEKPFRCFDGNLALTIKECKGAKRRFIGMNINLFVYPEVDIETDILLTDKNDIIGSIKISSNTFVEKEKNNLNSTTSSNPVTVLSIKGVPTSNIRSSRHKYDITRQDHINKLFPYGDKNNNYTLEYEYSVLSTAVEISIDDNKKFKNNAILSLAYDFPIYMQTSQSILDPLNDVCLAKLEPKNKTWECTNLKTTTQATTYYELEGNINETGIYAIILSPKPDLITINIIPDFFFRYIFIILGTGAGLSILILIGMYIFYRIYRYRGKLKVLREKNKQFEVKMQELSFMGSSYHLGQTLGDTIDKVVYTNNPCFRVKQDDSKNKRVEELENLQDSILKKYRALEKNNEELKKNYETINNEVNRLKEYKEQLEKNNSEIVKSEEEE